MSQGPLRRRTSRLQIPPPDPTPGVAEPAFRRPRGEPNPVLLRELRSRFRAPRAFNVLTTFLLFAAGLAWAVYARGASGPANPGLDAALAIGPMVFGAVLLAELVTVLLVAPGLTMAAISGEIERRTYELLLATPLTGAEIHRGKLGAAMAYLLLLMFSVLPVASLAFVLGGLELADLLRSQVAILVAGLLLASFGLLASTWLGRTERAAILAYLGTAMICLGPLVALWLIGLLGLPGRLLRELLIGALACLTPLLSTFAAGREGMRALLFGAGSTVGEAGGGVFLAQSLSLQLLLAAVFSVIAADRIRPSGQQRRNALILGGLLVAWLFWLLIQPVDWQLLLGAGGA